MLRCDERQADQLRAVKITRNYIKHAEGSVLIEVGDTKVICTATIEEKVPPFVKGTGKGWITAEYSMLPRATQTRTIRESAKGKIGGRTFEIQRLIGRALRAVVNLEALGERTIWLDCDVIQADGGTRTASITGSFVALADALYKVYKEKNLEKFAIKDFLAATSVGIVKGTPILDLCYEEDSHAEVDMNIVLTGSGKIVELQGTAEGEPFSREEMDNLFCLAKSGIENLITEQRKALGEIADEIGR